MKTSNVVGWAAVLLYAASQAAGIQLMFYFHPAPEVDVVDVATIKHAMPLLHWGHVLAGAVSGVAFLAFAVVSRGSGTIVRLASGAAAVLMVVMLWSGFRFTSRHSTEGELRSYIIHTLGLPLLLSLGLMVLAIFRVIGWLKVQQGRLGERRV